MSAPLTRAGNMATLGEPVTLEEAVTELEDTIHDLGCMEEVVKSMAELGRDAEARGDAAGAERARFSLAGMKAMCAESRAEIAELQCIIHGKGGAN